MTPEQLKEIRDQLGAVAPWGDIDWSGEDWPDANGAMRIVGESARGGPVENALGVLTFLEDAASHVTGLLSHADALQARLDAAEAERDQLRAIFSRDLLEDSEALRLAYELGRTDAKREYSTEINQAFEHLTDSDHDDDEPFDEFNEGLWDDTATGTTEATQSAPLPPGVHVGTADVLHDGTGDMIEFVRDAAMRAMGLPGSVFQGEPSFPPVTLEAKKLPLQTRVTDELLRDAGGIP